MPSAERWPFESPPDAAVFTLKRILWEGKPVLRVHHDAEDGAWQFLDGGDLAEEDAAVVGLAEMVDLDRTLLDLADLPPGWSASRQSPKDPWKKRKT